VTVEPFDAHGATVIVDGDLDLAVVPELEEAMAAVTANGHRHLVIDLSAATFLDSMATGVLLASLRPLRAHHDAAVVLAGATGIVERSLVVSGVGSLFSMFPDRPTAIRRVRGSTDTLRQSWRQIGRRSSPLR